MTQEDREETRAAALAATVPTAPGLSEDEMGKHRVIAQETSDMIAKDLADWLAEHRLVGHVDDLGMGIYGIEASGPNGEPVSISLVINPTQ